MLVFLNIIIDQGRRNSKISGEAAIENTMIFALFPQKLVSQPLKSGEAAASPASPVPPPLITIFFGINSSFQVSLYIVEYIWFGTYKPRYLVATRKQASIPEIFPRSKRDFNHTI